MESNNQLQKTDIRNHMCYYFDDMISIKIIRKHFGL